MQREKSEDIMPESTFPYLKSGTAITHKKQGNDFISEYLNEVWNFSWNYALAE